MMLNIHIKRDADLSPQAIDASLKQAHDFFTKTFHEHHFKAFITRTWLIHRGIMALIGDPNSHIVQFGNRFEVIASSHNRYQAPNASMGQPICMKSVAWTKQPNYNVMHTNIRKCLGLHVGLSNLKTSNNGDRDFIIT